MFQKTDSSEDKKIDNLILEFKEFKNRRKIVELDLEKKILTLEDVFNKIEKNIDIIQNIKDIDALKDIKNAKETLRTLEDLTLADRLELIENKECTKDISDKLEVFNHKIDLMSNALKIFDEKIKNTKQNDTNTQNNSDLVIVLDELSKIKEKINDIEKTNPIGEKEFKIIHAEFEKVNSDFAELISGVREEIDIYDKKIETLIDEIKYIKNIDHEIGKNENKYLGILNIIKNMQELSKQLELKTRTNEICIEELKKNMNIKIESQIDKLSEQLETKIMTIKQNGQSQQKDPINTDIQDLHNNTINNINTKITELNTTITKLLNDIETEKTNTNQKISDAMDAVKLLLENTKTNKIHPNENIDVEIQKINSELIEQLKTIKKIEERENLQTKINNIFKAKIDDIEKIKDIDKLKTKIEEEIKLIKKENTDNINNIETNIKNYELKIENRLNGLGKKETKNYENLLNTQEILKTEIKEWQDQTEKKNIILSENIIKGLNNIKKFEEYVNTIDKLDKNKTIEYNQDIQKTRDTMTAEINQWQIKTDNKIKMSMVHLKDEISEINNSSFEKIKNETKTLNEIQTKINKVIKAKIDNLDNTIFKTKTEQVSNETTKEILNIITLLKNENKILSNEIQMLNERLNRIEHSGQTESCTPLILE
ncbi:MAG: hypothetical protein K0B07_04050 [DPANN group archaeon]|nr:hypothetical protein [DPANN group archaeon]